MKRIKPVAISDAMLTSSDVPEGAGTAYNSGTTYALNARVDVQTGTVIDVYQSRKNGNMLLYSQDFTNAAWTAGAGTTRTADTTLAPDGTLSADTLTDTSTTTSNAAASQVISIPNDGSSYTASVFIKKTAGAPTNPVCSLILFGGSIPVTTGTVIDTTTGTLNETSGSWGVVDAGGYWRIWGRIPNNTSGNVSLQFSLYPIYSLDPPSTGSIVVWGAQVEKGSVLTDYTATTSAAVANLNNAPAASPAWWRKVADTYAAYAAGTTYAKDAIVIDPVAHRRYESVQNANTGHSLTDPLWWTDDGPTNRWAMFDQVVGTVSTEIGAMNLTLTPGLINALVLLDIDAELVTVTMTNGGAVVYSQTKTTNVAGIPIDNWWAYFYAPRGRKTTLTFLDLPTYPNATVSITLTGSDPAGPVSVGTLAVGLQVDIGLTEASPTVGITDYSEKETDKFGVTSVVERPFSKRMEVRCMLPSANVDVVDRALTDVRAVPCVWIGGESYDCLLAYGFYKEFSIDLAFGTVSYCTLSIEGLT